MTFYGLKTCDSCRKAKRWLAAHELDFVVHDVRDDGLSSTLLRSLADAAGWERLLNKNSKTWRSLPDSAKQSLDKRSTIALLSEHPTLMKRPVLVYDDTVLVGFSEDTYSALLP